MVRGGVFHYRIHLLIVLFIKCIELYGLIGVSFSSSFTFFSHSARLCLGSLHLLILHRKPEAAIVVTNADKNNKLLHKLNF